MNKLRIFFAGTKDFAESHLKLLIKHNHNIVGIFTKKNSYLESKNKVIKLALNNNIPIFYPKSLFLEKYEKIIKELKPDIIIVVSYGLIFPKKILCLPPLGCINVHASLLPKWRGSSPIQRALINGEKKIGISIIKMNEKLDEGDIINQIEYKVLFNDTTNTILNKFKKLSPCFLIKTLKKICNKDYCTIPQNKKNSSYANKINKKEAKINWNLPAKKINLYIRAFNPWPICYFISNQKEVIKIFEAKIIKNFFKNVPGKILFVNKKTIHISTSYGIISPIILQPENKRIMSCEEFLNSRKKYFSYGTILSK